MLRRSLQRACTGMLFVSVFLLLVSCRIANRLLPETGTPLTPARWSRITLPPQSRLWHLAPNLGWVIYETENPPGTKGQWNFWLAQIEADGKLASPMLIAESTEENVVAVHGFSPDSSSFLLETINKQDQFSKASIWLINVTHVQDKHLIYTGASPLHGVSWAPDSRRLAVFTADWGADLVTTDGAVTSTVVPASTFAKVEVSLSWSPQSDQIVYSDMRESSVTVWIAGVKSGQRRLLSTQPWPVRPIWSPTGEAIALLGFTEPGEKSRPQLTVLNAGGHVLTSINLPGWPEHNEGIWSPDGKRFALVLKEGREASQTYAEIVNLPAGRSSNILLEDSEGGRLRGWNPDSQALIVETFRDGAPVLMRLAAIPQK